MKNNSLDLTRIIFLSVSVLILLIGLLIPGSHRGAAITAFLAVGALILFDIKAPYIANLSEDNPKVKTIRRLNRLTIALVIIFSLTTVLAPFNDYLSTSNGDILLTAFISLIIMVIGNSAPKIPFNRYLGLRLPWTIRDEETWKLAHKILGYISFPIGISQFIGSFFLPAEKVSVFFILLWIAVPGLYSLWFYYKKFKK
ncbi:SdpI family protein [Clostridium polynesiense]|uniref:SdpI family protein n=1 Tax=Clostridium polynesiense TaxID=1325933 RepID=UPI00058E9747|nr:SdpI family protein [Clostridium polynesiense]